jgi:homeobox-leucine zipper protein
MFPAGNGGTIELVYMQVSTICSLNDVPLAFLVMCSTHSVFAIIFLFLQMYAPTTLVPARDFWTLRYTTTMEDGSLVVCLNLNTISFYFDKYYQLHHTC